jgi:hypothetical protein
MISESTKGGLAEAKRRGVVLGGLNEAGIARRQEAIVCAEEVMHMAGQSQAVDMFLNFPVMDMNRNAIWRNPGGVPKEGLDRVTRFCCRRQRLSDKMG